MVDFDELSSVQREALLGLRDALRGEVVADLDVDIASVAIGAKVRIKRLSSYRDRVWAWAKACFGEVIAMDKQERIQRFCEEALELCQTCDLSKEWAHQLVDYVYGRPKGEKWQEVGGVMSTLNSLCYTHELDPFQCGEKELARAWIKIDIIREKQKSKPRNSPLPIPVEQTKETYLKIPAWVEVDTREFTMDHRIMARMVRPRELYIRLETPI